MQTERLFTSCGFDGTHQCQDLISCNW